MMYGKKVLGMIGVDHNISAIIAVFRGTAKNVPSNWITDARLFFSKY
jgi:hypothetical protein